MKIAVLGGTGTAGSRTIAKLAGIDTVPVSRSTGVDLLSGTGLQEALEGVDAVIDASNTFPPDDMSVQDAISTATRNVLAACTAQQVRHLVVLSIIGIRDPVFDVFPYYLAKRAQEDLVTASPIPATLVKTSQWHEFATNPAAVTFHDDAVEVRDWLIQPVAVDAVADVLVEAALGEPAPTMLITGPERIRLPELTTQLLARRGDPRPVRATPPTLPGLTEGVLLAPDDAIVRGPDVETWLSTQHPDEFRSGGLGA